MISKAVSLVGVSIHLLDAWLHLRVMKIEYIRGKHLNNAIKLFLIEVLIGFFRMSR